MFEQKRSDYDFLFESVLECVDWYQRNKNHKTIYYSFWRKSEQDLPLLEFDHNPYTHIDEFISLTGADFRIIPGQIYGADYYYKDDKIVTTELKYFMSLETAYICHCHELIHWTMPINKCNREMLYFYNNSISDKCVWFLPKTKIPITDQHHSSLYLREEFVAQLGATLLAHDLGIDYSKIMEYSICYLCYHLNQMKRSASILEYYYEDAQDAVEFLHSTVRGNLSNSKGT